MRHLFLTRRFYLVLATIIATMMLSYPFPILLPFVKTALVLFAVVALADFLVLFQKNVVIHLHRLAPKVLSLGDDNEIAVVLKNASPLSLRAELIDELPEQLQVRNFSQLHALAPGQEIMARYTVRPLVRGEFNFGKIHLFLQSAVGLVSRRISREATTAIPVYPSILQMKKYEINVSARVASEFGVKRVRRTGHSYEFEHIKQYIRGDDYRSINWKATGRRAALMVNQYEDEKSQQIYCVIDKSRAMHMPFNGLSLFDYAVNTTLVISNIVLSKHDKAGLITFAETPKTIVKAERNKDQLKKIIEALYSERESMVEANFEGLYLATQKFVTGRCMLLLFTNFESSYALQRVLPQLRKLNDRHLLVVVFFENSEIATSTSEQVETLEDIYTQVTAEQFALTKIQLMQELRQEGIICILTPPEGLTASSINKYLEVKSRGLI